MLAGSLVPCRAKLCWGVCNTGTQAFLTHSLTSLEPPYYRLYFRLLWNGALGLCTCSLSLPRNLFPFTVQLSSKLARVLQYSEWFLSSPLFLVHSLTCPWVPKAPCAHTGKEFKALHHYCFTCFFSTRLSKAETSYFILCFHKKHLTRHTITAAEPMFIKWMNEWIKEPRVVTICPQPESWLTLANALVIWVLLSMQSVQGREDHRQLAPLVVELCCPAP